MISSSRLLITKAFPRLAGATRRSLLSSTIPEQLKVLKQAVFNHELEDAKNMLEKIVSHPESVRHRGKISEGLRFLILHYRRDVDNMLLPFERRKDALDNAERLFLAHKATLNDEKLTFSMMDTFSRLDKHEQVEALFNDHEQARNNVYACGIMIRSYGKRDMADKATNLLKSMLSDPDNRRICPNEHTFAETINAWGQSSDTDRIEKALAVHRLMDEDPKCIRADVRPTTATFNSLLKCATYKSKDIGNRAIEILDDMERRDDVRARPNVITYTLVIASLISIGNFDQAENVMDRMKNSSVPPNARMYNTILNYWKDVGTAEAAKRAEEILVHMIRESKKGRADVKPDSFSYTIVMGAWYKSNHSKANLHILRLHDAMMKEGIQPANLTLGTMINKFTQSDERKWIEQAETVLRYMEASEEPDLQPDFRFFNPIIRGFIRIGDVEHATRILMRIARRTVDHKDWRKFKPDPILIDQVMMAWIKLGNYLQATALLDKMKNLFETGHLPAGPDLRSFENLYNFWRKSDKAEKDVHVLRLGAVVKELVSKELG